VPVDQIPLELLDAVQEYRHFEGVTQTEAEALFGSAIAAVYFPDTGEVRMLSNDNLATARILLSHGEHIRAPTPAAAAVKHESGRGLHDMQVASGFMTLRSFLNEVPGAGNAGADLAGRRLFLAKVPSTSTADPNLAAPPRPLPVIEKTLDSAYIFEDFEGDVWSLWSRSDNTGGNYQWGVRSCDSHYGSYSADAARGGTLGSGLSCGASYPNNLQLSMSFQACKGPRRNKFC
jgi:hypothetical protein